MTTPTAASIDAALATTAPRRRHIVVVPGDGIGKEVVPAALRVLEMLNTRFDLGVRLTHKDWGADKWINEGVGLEPGAIAWMKDEADAVFLGALGDPRIPDMAHGREILLGMRFELDLYVNLRPTKLMMPALCPLKGKTADDIDIVIFRENTEGLYVGTGGRVRPGTPDEVAIDEMVQTRRGVERIIRAAFDYADKNGRQKVTMSDKSNAVRHTGALWKETFAAVAKDYPHIETDHRYVDVMAMQLVTSPEAFDVVVTGNLFGDVLSDIGAGLMGSLGMAASANLHPGQIGLFEPVHGSAPDIAGQGIANPLASIMTVGMMLTELGVPGIEALITAAVQDVLDAGETTPDLGGAGTTESVTSAVLTALEKRLA